MSSTTEGNDDFDWEAAALEIDAACSKATPSTLSFPSNIADNRHPVPENFEVSSLHRFPSDGNDPIAEFEVDRCCNDVQGFTKPTLSSIQIDPVAATTWIYPTNIPFRDYQFAITKTALFSNTLVALPTGLGKTLIAAVVMYNYFRWFPEGKVVFAAPSRPLVMQQIEACHNIVGISQELTIDMTGQINQLKRAELWNSKRVFFVTPQVLENDLQAGICLVKSFVCLVFDEAHRAQGNYSYCVVIRELLKGEMQFRILALTATPGSKQPSVQCIIDNLNISTLEYRNEDDPDVIPFVHNRNVELIEVPLGKEATNVNELLLDVIRPFMTKLSSMGMHLTRDCQSVSPPDLLKLRDKFRVEPPPSICQTRYGEIEGYFACLITLLHIRKLLLSHGLKPAFDMLEEKLKQGSFAKFMSRNETIVNIRQIMSNKLNHGAHSPKLSKLLEVLVDHFREKDSQNSRVMIFSNYRGSVRDILDTLSTIEDTVKAAEFIGQSSGRHSKGQSQKMQQAVLQKFRDGGYNVIVATSIGEEGLDIMEVDLVICFDANVSPLRMIQRMGRTGRKNNGRVVVLACEGSEIKGYKRKHASCRSMKKLLHNGGIASFNFHPSPRMVPHAIKPEVCHVELFIKEYIPRGKTNKISNAVASSFERELTTHETNLLRKYFDKPWKPSLIAFPRSQTFPCESFRVMHSFRTDLFIQSMQFLRNLSTPEVAIVDETPKSSKEVAIVAETPDSSKEVAIVDESPDSSKEVAIVDETPDSSKEVAIVDESPDSSKGIINLQFPASTPAIVDESPDHLKDEQDAVLCNELNPLVNDPELLNSPEFEYDFHESFVVHESPNMSPQLSADIVPESPPDTNETTNREQMRISEPPKYGFGILRKAQKSVVENTVSPVVDSSNKSSSEDWLLSSQSQPARALKRLRRASDFSHQPREIFRRKRKSTGGAKGFVDDEAEVGSSGDRSSDEEVGGSSYDDSFIDDRTDPTPGSCEVDMMGIYRRSLLSPSPFDGDASKLTKVERKRKLDFVPPSNNDDHFFDSVDFDALEKQAISLVPSFDLGI